MEKIRVKNVNKDFTSKGRTNRVLQDINFEVEEGGLTCLLGSSGSGKTTLLNLMAGFEQPTSGEILIDNKKVTGPDPNYQILFQGYGLFPWRNVLGNTEFGLEAHGITKQKRKNIALEYLNLVGLEHDLESFPHQLSGGMQQRVAVARALAVDPDVLFMDEPFAALDAITRNHMQEELIKIWHKKQKTIVFVTHDIDEAIYLADNIIILSSDPGRIQEIIPIEIGRPRDRTEYNFVNIRKKIFTTLALRQDATLEYYL